MFKGLFTTKKVATGAIIAIAASSVGVVAGATYNYVWTSGSGWWSRRRVRAPAG